MEGVWEGEPSERMLGIGCQRCEEPAEPCRLSGRLSATTQSHSLVLHANSAAGCLHMDQSRRSGT